MYSRNKDWFVSSSAWLGKRSRVLQRMGGKFHQSIDVSIEPINHTAQEWQDLAKVMIRYHRTHEEDKGRFNHVISDANFDCLVRNVGERVADIIVHEDLLPEIDEHKLKMVHRQWHWGGGVPFILVCKDPTKYPELIEFWKQYRNLHHYAHLFKDLFEQYDKWLASDPFLEDQGVECNDCGNVMPLFALEKFIPYNGETILICQECRDSAQHTGRVQEDAIERGHHGEGY
jgi:hypothetical protein